VCVRYLTAGDSHGDTLEGVIEGLPAGIRVSAEYIRRELRRRSQTYGRSARQKVEGDEVVVRCGLWNGMTTGAPLAIAIVNVGKYARGKRPLGGRTVPRPGHADLAGCLKYGFRDWTPVAERASARSTAMRVAVGAVAKAALGPLGIEVASQVLAIGTVRARRSPRSFEEMRDGAEASPVRCADPEAAADMIGAIDRAREEGVTLGGCVEVVARGVPPGLGSYAEWDRRMDARLAAALVSVQSVKAVEIGDAIEASGRTGEQVNDGILFEKGTLLRVTNFAGGIEGGVTNGEPVVVRAYSKPIPSVRAGLPSVDLESLSPARSPYPRSDVCVVPALSVIAEAVVAWEILRSVLEKFGGDTFEELRRAHASYMSDLRERGWRR